MYYVAESNVFAAFISIMSIQMLKRNDDRNLYYVRFFMFCLTLLLRVISHFDIYLWWYNCVSVI